MNEKSWASLAPLLDHRRYVESMVAGITIAAHPDFRCAVTMNEDESTFEVPDYILSRLQPTLTLGFPTKQDELAILQYHLPFAEAEMLDLTVEFLQGAHELKLDFSTRDGINVLRYAIKRLAQDQQHPLGKGRRAGASRSKNASARTPSTSKRSPTARPGRWAAAAFPWDWETFSSSR